MDLAVYLHGPHGHNVKRMLEAMKASLTVFSESFSPYQFKQARILEFLAYASFAQSFANTIPYSEGVGFIQNYDDARSDSTIDLVTYITAHEIAHQWWAAGGEEREAGGGAGDGRAAEVRRGGSVQQADRPELE